MNLIAFNRLCRSMKARAQLKERVDLSKFNGNETHGVMTKNKNRYNAKPNFNFAVNDILNKNNAIFNFNSATQK